MLPPRQIILRAIVMWTLSMALISFMTPVEKQYPEISYFDFQNQMENKEIVEVAYNSDDNFAIVKTAEDDTEYKLNIISKENFELDIYQYSLSQESFIYSKYQGPTQLNVFPALLILLTFNIIGHSLWKKAYLKIHFKKNLNIKESKVKKQDENLDVELAFN